MTRKISSHSVSCLFILLVVSFVVEKLFNLIWFHLLIPYVISHAIVNLNHLLSQPKTKDFVFSSIFVGSSKTTDFQALIPGNCFNKFIYTFATLSRLIPKSCYRSYIYSSFSFCVSPTTLLSVVFFIAKHLHKTLSSIHISLKSFPSPNAYTTQDLKLLNSTWQCCEALSMSINTFCVLLCWRKHDRRYNR